MRFGSAAIFLRWKTCTVITEKTRHPPLPITFKVLRLHTHKHTQNTACFLFLCTIYCLRCVLFFAGSHISRQRVKVSSRNSGERFLSGCDDGRVRHQHLNQPGRWPEVSQGSPVHSCQRFLSAFISSQFAPKWRQWVMQSRLGSGFWTAAGSLSVHAFRPPSQPHIAAPQRQALTPHCWLLQEEEEERPGHQLYLRCCDVVPRQDHIQVQQFTSMAPYTC